MTAAGRLVRASHPEPAAAVTAIAVLLAVSFDVRGWTLLLVAVAVGSGQASVGWCNDLVDARRDRTAGRRDKPLATGSLTAGTVRAATGAALLVTVVASLALGWVPGLLHLAMVAGAWAYDLGLKRTVWSWLPYTFCFGALPALAALVPADSRVPPAWMLVAGALLGVGAHLLNAVPDLQDDLATGVHGLPQRLGARRSLDLATVLLLAGSVVAVVGPDSRLTGPGLATLAVVAVVAAVGRLARGRAPFLAAMVVAGVDVVSLLVNR